MGLDMKAELKQKWIEALHSGKYRIECAICKEKKGFMSFCPRGLKIREEWAGWRLFEVCNNCCMKEQDRVDDLNSQGVGI